MKLTLKCFSHVKAALDRDELTVELPDGSSAADLEAHVRDLTGNALDGIPLRIAVNRTFVPDGHALADGDEVALIPQVQGG